MSIDQNPSANITSRDCIDGVNAENDDSVPSSVASTNSRGSHSSDISDASLLFRNWDEVSSGVSVNTCDVPVGVNDSFFQRFLKKTFMFFAYVARISNRNYEFQMNTFIVFIEIVIFSIFMVVVMAVFLVTKGKKIVEELNQGIVCDELVCVSVAAVAIFVLVDNIILFWVIRNFHVFMFVFNAVVMTSMLFVHFYICRFIGLMQGSTIVVGLVPIMSSFYFETTVQFVMWSGVYALSFLAGYIKDEVMVNRESLVEYYQTRSSTLTKNVVRLMYLFMVLTVLLSFVVCLFVLLRKKRKEKIVKKIGGAILSLNFDDEFLKNLEKKDARFVGKIDKLFIAMIHNLKIYEKFLPETFTRLHSETVDETHTTLSAPDPESTDGSNESFENRKDAKIVCPLGKIAVDYSFNVKKDVVIMKVLMSTEDCPVPCVDVPKYFIDIVTFNVHRSGGVIHDVSSTGIEILVSYNLMKRSTESAKKSIKSAFKVQRSFEKRYPRMRMFISICQTNNVVAGTLQSGNNAHFLILGNHRVTLEKMKNLHIERHKGIVVCEKIFCETKFHFEFKQLEFFNGLKVYEFSGKELINESQEIKNEWMYVLKQSSFSSEVDKSSVRYFNSIWDVFIEGHVETAKQMLTEYMKVNSDDIDAEYLMQKIEFGERSTIVRSRRSSFEVPPFEKCSSVASLSKVEIGEFSDEMEKPQVNVENDFSTDIITKFKTNIEGESETEL